MTWVFFDYRNCAQKPPEFDHSRSVVCLGPRALPFALPASHVAVWVVLRGSLNGQQGDRHWAVDAREAIVWPDGSVRLTSGRNCWAIGLVIPIGQWGNVAASDTELPALWQARASRKLASALLSLVRSLRANADDALAGHTALVEAWSHQEPAQQLLSRCPGRTLQSRRRALSRLLRVRHSIQNDFEASMRLELLARQAKYSPHHLVRLYREVFGLTPTEHAAALREQRAWELVSRTPLSISDITAELGFDSRSSFCRAFKARYGVTATEVRAVSRR